jgi:hypothetical protein
VRTTTALEEFHSADFVIEAVAEDEALKRRIFAELDKVGQLHWWCKALFKVSGSLSAHLVLLVLSSAYSGLWSWA